VPVVVQLLLVNLHRCLRDALVLALGQPREQRQLVGVEQELAQHREGPVALRQFDELHVAPVRRIAEEGQRVRRPAGERLMQAVPQLRVAQLVLRDVGQADILFQDRRVARPLGVAVGEDQFVITQGQQPGRQGGVKGGHS